MTDRLADTALRVLAPRARALGSGDPDSLQNVNTFELPNGALCWVNETLTLYRLDKNSTSNIGTITPIAGPGRWVPLAGNGVGLILDHSGEAVLAAPPAIAAITVIGNWVDFAPSVFIGNNGSDFTLNPAGGVLTYNGLSGKWFKLTLELSATAAGGPPGPFVYESAIDINGNLLPNLATPNAAAVSMVSGEDQTMATSMFAQLNAGDQIRAVVRNNTLTISLIGIFVHLHIIPIS